MTSQRVERTWICTGGYGQFRGERGLTLMVSYLAKGEQNADCEFGKFTVPDSNTCSPGTNFKLFGLGVS